MRINRVIMGVLGFMTLMAACSILVPRKGWDPSYGPVVPHDTFPADCALCHESGSWHKMRADFAFDHEKQAGLALNGAHDKASCLLCHNDRGPVKQFAAKGCAGCHEDIHRGRLGHLCSDCHTEDNWRPLTAILDHTRTRFPLVGAHAAVACYRCHQGAQVGQFDGLSVACEDCHQEDLARATNPNHTSLNLTSDCQRCHTTFGWKPASFSHPASFPLSGGHSNRGCTECHSTGVYTGLSTDCASCHLNDFQATRHPSHVAAGFSTMCLECHTTSRWQGATFNHPSAFPLTNGHAGRDCAECHTTPGTFAGLSNDCASCHTDDYQRTNDPNHLAAGFSTNCTQCHGTTQWRGATFTHTPAFPLTNGHAGRSCNACHTTPGVFSGLNGQCATCHTDDYQRTTNPNHAAAGISTNCTQCHNTTQWQGSTFAHPASFPLTSGHAGRSCTQCHTTPGVYSGLNTSCSSCHLDDFQGTTDPNHQAAGFSTNCTQCHNTRRWRGATFSHPASFPLTSGHAGRACNACHTTPGTYGGLNTDCASCHTDDYQRPTNPNHVTGGFPTNCLQCHNTAHWQGATFMHPPSFPLTNGHAGRGCTLCHTTPGTFTGLNTQCSTCHLDDYQRTTDPNHAAAHFSTNCTQCHGTTTWQGATFQHAAGFPLTAGHAGRACNECHQTPGTYGGLSITCASCHLDTYQTTTNPNHSMAGFPTTCNQCHNTTRWQGATFTHPPSFPLTNAHAGRACTVCHTTPGVYTGLSNQCSSCHLDDYQGTTNPNHIGAGFPMNCAQCHGTVRWQGATFTHPPSFPLTQGHAGRACSACHTTPGVYTGLTNDCVTCHLDNYQATNDPNHTSAGYPTTCTLCHNTTTWQNATFSHTPRINSGPHRILRCNNCHLVANNWTSFSCTHCHEHRQSSMANDHSGVSGYIWSSPACLSCHPNP